MHRTGNSMRLAVIIPYSLKIEPHGEEFFESLVKHGTIDFRISGGDSVTEAFALANSKFPIRIGSKTLFRINLTVSKGGFDGRAEYRDPPDYEI